MNTQQPLFPLHIFRAYDIRGKVSVLTPQLVHAIALGLVEQFQQQQQTHLVIGYDARLTSPSYAYIVQQVFEQHGFQVSQLGCCSTPQMYFAARETQGNGIMVTASHNPKTDNGIKWIIQSQPPSPEVIQAVGQRAALNFYHQPALLDLSLLNRVQSEIKAQYCLKYQQAMLSDIQLKRPLKVVLDGMRGSAGHCADLVLQKLGCEVISIRCQANGEFPEHAPDPSHAVNLTQLQEKIQLHQADIGMALDGDGDRVVILDENAQIISADRLLSLFAELCLQTHPEHEFVYDVKCSTMVKQTVQKWHGRPTMIRTGSSFMRNYLSKTEGKAVFGGEYAGHYVFNDGRGFGYDDGLYAALRIMEFLSQHTEQTLSQILARYPERCGTEDTYISSHGVDPDQVLQLVSERSQLHVAEVQKIDGIRLDFDNGFGIMRASNTGEFFTVRFDADSSEGLEGIRQTFVSMLSDQYPDIAQDIAKAQ